MPRGQSSKQPLPNTTDSATSTRRVSTRSAGKVAEPTTKDAGNRVQKRKAKDPPSADPPNKRSNARGPKLQEALPPANTEGAAEPAPRMNIRSTEQEKTQKSKTVPRKAPIRPALSLDSEDGEDNHQENETMDGGATSPFPSDDEADELPTATQLTAECPITARAIPDVSIVKSHGGNNTFDDVRSDSETAAIRPNGGKRVECIIREVPVLSLLLQEPDYSQDTSCYGMTAVHLPTNPLPNPGNANLTQPTPVWPTFTNLIQDDDGSYKQTGQITEINNFLSAAVKRANTNLVLIDSFPNVDEQERWLVDALRFELTARNQNQIIKAVGERARADINYSHCLLSMIRNRWSSYRQSALKVARALVGTRGKEKPSEKTTAKSSYGLSGSNTDKVTTALKLLDHDAFHFGRTSADTIDPGAPYQRREMFIMLAHFFKADDSLKNRVPTGIHGLQIPEAMVALAATLIEFALLEVAEGKRLQFSEDNQRERYLAHLASFERVKASKDGHSKNARLLSNIYNGTMNPALHKRTRTPAPGVPTRPTLMDTDRMPV